MRCTVHHQEGFTLMELLVVLLIIGVLSTVAIRTIDATRDRAFFDQTTAEMERLVYAITGNPDVREDGGRVDFGFFGDLGRLPDSLRELVENTSGSTNWHGPYFRQGLAGDSLNFMYDAWGNPYTYDRTTGVVTTIGNGRFPMSVRVFDSQSELYDNSIVGQVLDANGNPPGAGGARVFLYTNCGRWSGYTPVGEGGGYEFSPDNNDTVPLGIHRLVALQGADSIVRWVTVAPRSRTVVDFHYSKSFRTQLQMVGQPRIPVGVPDSSGFEFDVVSTHNADKTIDSIRVDYVSDSLYFRILQVDRTTVDSFPDDSLVGPGQATAIITPGVTIAPNMAQIVTFGFFDFASDPTGADTANIHNRTFRFWFSDGSVITVKP